MEAAAGPRKVFLDCGVVTGLSSRLATFFFEREKSAKFVSKTRRRRGVSKGFEREYFMIMKDYITHFCILVRKAPKVFILCLIWLLAGSRVPSGNLAME